MFSLARVLRAALCLVLLLTGSLTARTHAAPQVASLPAASPKPASEVRAMTGRIMHLYFMMFGVIMAREAICEDSELDLVGGRDGYARAGAERV